MLDASLGAHVSNEICPAFGQYTITGTGPVLTGSLTAQSCQPAGTAAALDLHGRHVSAPAKPSRRRGARSRSSSVRPHSVPLVRTDGSIGHRVFSAEPSVPPRQARPDGIASRRRRALYVRHLCLCYRSRRAAPAPADPLEMRCPVVNKKLKSGVALLPVAKGTGGLQPVAIASRPRATGRCTFAAPRTPPALYYGWVRAAWVSQAEPPMRRPPTRNRKRPRGGVECMAPLLRYWMASWPSSGL